LQFYNLLKIIFVAQVFIFLSRLLLFAKGKIGTCLALIHAIVDQITIFIDLSVIRLFRSGVWRTVHVQDSLAPIVIFTPF